VEIHIAGDGTNFGAEASDLVSKHAWSRDLDGVVPIVVIVTERIREVKNRHLRDLGRVLGHVEVGRLDRTLGHRVGHEEEVELTYVDNGYVEQSEVIDGKFDFFLVPHSVTQGSVKPTHFYVAKNSSQISKMAILYFTYALCYNYYNWNDAIKIPAPCMLADKIAGFRSEVGTIPSNVDLHNLPFYL
jgi:hypothetical protein